MTMPTNEITEFDTVGAEAESLSTGFKAYLDAKREVVGGVATTLGEKSTFPQLEDGHKLIIPGLHIDYVYELEPRLIDGVWHFQYGIDATKFKKKIAGYVLHHTSETPFDNLIQYMSRRDETRGGSFGYHFLIGKDGRVAQTAPLSARTNHMRSATNRTNALHLTNVNTCSISLHGGYKVVSDSNSVHLPATDEQISSARTVLTALERIVDVPLEQAWGHGEIQSDRMREEALVLAEWCRTPVVFS